MSRSDPSAATGQQPYEPSRCTCGHVLVLHVPVGGVRRSCSMFTCDCERYTDPPAGGRDSTSGPLHGEAEVGVTP